MSPLCTTATLNTSRNPAVLIVPSNNSPLLTSISPKKVLSMFSLVTLPELSIVIMPRSSSVGSPLVKLSTTVNDP